jgi:hypothetical protein
MGLVNPQVFVGTRCRLCRHRDAKFVNGWIQYFRGESLIVTTDDTIGSEPGDNFYVEAYGSKIKACVNATLKGIAAQDAPEGGQAAEPAKLTFLIYGHLQVVENGEASRVLVDRMFANVKVGGQAFQAKVRDVSIKGVGLFVESDLAKGTEISLEFETPMGPVVCTGVVRHVRKERGKNVAGVELTGLSRLDGSRWRRLLGEAA